MKRAAILLVLLALVDWALTADGIILGICREANPLMRATFDAGFDVALAVKLAVTAAGAGALLLARAERALWVCVFAYAGLIAYQVAARAVIF